MIFLTIGTAHKGFDRLIRECDKIAGQSNIEFFAQIGSSSYIPKNMVFKEWLSENEMKKRYSEAKAFLIHAGFGTISETLKYNKPIYVVPRLFKYGEAVNNHQLELAEKLDSLGFVKCIDELSKLYDELLKLDSFAFKKYDLENRIPDLVSEFVKGISIEKNRAKV